MFAGGMVLKAIVDQKRCQSVGICVQQLPEVFQFQPGSKKAMVIKKEIPVELERKCREVAAQCPQQAIIVAG
jgi:ferredoxin